MARGFTHASSSRATEWEQIRQAYLRRIEVCDSPSIHAQPMQGTLSGNVLLKLQGLVMTRVNPETTPTNHIPQSNSHQNDVSLQHRLPPRLGGCQVVDPRRTVSVAHAKPHGPYLRIGQKNVQGNSAALRYRRDWCSEGVLALAAVWR